MTAPQDHQKPKRRIFVRGPWENAATVLIALGVVMLTQPYSMLLFRFSFAMILAGTIGFLIVSHFRE